MSATKTEQPAKTGGGLSLPGQPTEEALAEVGSDAGKALVRGFGRLGNAALGEWVAKKEAKAEAARLAIETDAKINAAKAVAAAGREQALADLEHNAALQRRAERLRIELAREQLNLEAMERRALEYVERDPENGSAREVDEDWLFKFADLAQKVSDSDVQSLWARALSSVAIQGAPKLSAAALQTLGLFDAQIAESFRNFVAVVATFGFLPEPEEGEHDPQGINLGILHDLGLIDNTLYEGTYSFEDFSFEAIKRTGPLPADLRSHYALTLRGREIASAVFRRSEDVPLGEQHEHQYLRLILLNQLKRKQAATILPSLAPDGQPWSIRLTRKNPLTKASSSNDWRSFSERISARLFKLLLWADERYDIEAR
ncbi:MULTISPECIES: DUF2806 domain-containing protein [Bradyrhizobium]|uniref:DUF2806 domain-containing protein n=1 Tax=Bradyrhizobium TaxID=374 RepID=UPI000481B3A0|nr:MULTISPECIES: DUF2806 domain-containing protein [Bradyrhizobium]UFW50022.1 DUF2806 domain-containing protein [Bradyrhizobium arachidis]